MLRASGLLLLSGLLISSDELAGVALASDYSYKSVTGKRVERVL